MTRKAHDSVKQEGKLKEDSELNTELNVGEDQDDSFVEEEDSVGNSQEQRPAVEMKVPLSQSLLTKLKKTAEEEGIAMPELAAELISEGLVMRVWDILERNQHLRASGHPNSHQGNANHQNRNNHNQRHFNQNRHRGNRNQNNLNILQDKAAFLEYVRNQEKKRR